ncbi:MAG: hypothetical protein Q8P45_03495 [Candidatus Harrisonbacteria bacterium]|nr:hypothetical protein [Candidatus Harrisonbacteria bacterium]
MADPGCSSPGDNSEANSTLSFAKGMAQLSFTNSWDQPIGEIIVLDGVWIAESGLPLKGNPDYFYLPFRVVDPNKDPIAPGETATVNLPFWSEYVTLFIRFLDAEDQLTPWIHPAHPEAPLEGESGTVGASVPIYFIPNVFGEYSDFSYVWFDGGDPFKG